MEHFADSETKKQLQAQQAQQKQISDQMVNTQRNLNRVEHDNKILRRGFAAIMKRHTEQCKDSTEKNQLQ